MIYHRMSGEQMHYRDFNTVKIKRNGQNKTVTFVASTDTPDRYGDIVDQKGWDLSAYKRNPVVLLNHNPTQLPIGKGHAYIKNGQLMLDVEFDKNDEMAQKVEQKVKGGFINAVSVGFQPSESIARNKLSADHPYHGKSGYYFPKSELLEVSIVTIPANNEATLSKNFVQKIGLVDIARSLITHKHIISVQQLDNGNYVVEFAGHEEPEMEQEEMEIEEDKAVHEDEEKYGHDDEEKGGHEDEEKEMDEDEEEKSFDFDAFLSELKRFNNN